MKRLLAVAAIVATSMVQHASAQPPGVILNPGESYVPGSLRDQFGNPVETQGYPPIRRPGDQPREFDTGYQSGGFYVDPISGQLIHRSNRSRRKSSAYDPNRHIVDPGSWRNVNEIQTDRYGVRWLVTGKTWTSLGRPHSELTRVRYQGGGGISNRIQDKVETREVQVVPSTAPTTPPSQSPSPSSSNVMDFFE